MSFLARAPGKIIITGEHFVVHGSYALAAAVGKGAVVKAEPSDRLKIVSKDLGLTAHLPGDVPERLLPLAESLKSTLAYLGEKRALKLTINSDVPPSSGLGSSSAVAVALVSAASRALGHHISKEKTVELAMVSERLVHGNPSGVDVNVASYGGVLMFKKGSPIQAVKLKGPVEFVVGLSGIERGTFEMVRRVSETKGLRPGLFEGLVSSSSRLSELAASWLERGELQPLGSLMNFYHAVLSWLGASLEAIDKMVEAALEAGAIGAKLTGGGGGGCMIALPEPGRSLKVVNALRRLGFKAFTAGLPVEGVRVWRKKS